MLRASILVAGLLALAGCSAFVPGPTVLSTPAVPAGTYPGQAPVYGNPFAPSQPPQRP